MIENIYIWETSDSAKLRLLRLNANAAEIEIPAYPKILRSLLARLQAKSSSLSVGLRAWNSPTHPPINASVATTVSHPRFAAIDIMTGWQFDKNIPAIVHPIVDNGRFPLQLDAQPSTGRTG